MTQLYRTISSQLRHVCISSRKKLVKQQHLLHMSSQHGELWPTNGWDWLANLVHPSKFQRVLCVGFVTAPTSLNGGQPNFAQCLAVSWAGELYIHFWGYLWVNGILPGAKFTVRPSLVFSYINSITARHSSSACQPNCVACFSRAATTWYFWWRRGIAVTSLGVSTKLLYVGPG